MALLNSLKRLFGTTKDLGAAKIEEIKDKSAPAVENAKECAKDVIEKAEEKIEKLEEIAEKYVDDLNDILQEKLKKTEPESDQPDNLDVKVEVPVNEVAGEAKPPVTDAHEVVEKAKE